MKNLYELEVFNDATESHLDLELKKCQVLEITQKIAEKKKYANRIFNFCVYSTATIGTILIFCGLGIMHLSDTIMSILLSTTVIQIFGLPVFLMKYLFGTSDK